jgi:hypothetical protein
MLEARETLNDTVTPTDDRRHDFGGVRPRDASHLSEDEVRSYLLGLRDRGVALGTFKTNHGGIQFLYRQTLDRDWPLFWKKKDSAAPAKAAA